MAELFIGGAAAAGFLLLVRYARDRGIPVAWWQWLLTVAAIAYGVLVVEIIVEFLREGTPKGAAVMGTVMGFVAVVWAALLGRWVFAPGHGTRGTGPAGEEAHV